MIWTKIGEVFHHISDSSVSGSSLSNSYLSMYTSSIVGFSSNSSFPKELAAVTNKVALESF